MLSLKQARRMVKKQEIREHRWWRLSLKGNRDTKRRYDFEKRRLDERIYKLEKLLARAGD